MNISTSVSEATWLEIERRANKHGYMTDATRDKERVTKTGEVFTPTSLVIEMLKVLPVETFAPGKTFLDPACGDGQLLVPVFWLKVLHFGMTKRNAAADLYGVDIMRDNVELCNNRLYGMANIVLGNTLEPDTWLDGQTYEEHMNILDWFAEDKGTTLDSFFN